MTKTYEVISKLIEKVKSFLRQGDDIVTKKFSTSYDDVLVGTIIEDSWSGALAKETTGTKRAFAVFHIPYGGCWFINCSYRSAYNWGLPRDTTAKKLGFGLHYKEGASLVVADESGSTHCNESYWYTDSAKGILCPHSAAVISCRGGFTIFVMGTNGTAYTTSNPLTVTMRAIKIGSHNPVTSVSDL